MNWIQSNDGDWINSSFVKELRVQTNDNSLDLKGSDSHLAIAVSVRMHEELAHELLTGTEQECIEFLSKVVQNDRRT